MKTPETTVQEAVFRSYEDFRQQIHETLAVWLKPIQNAQINNI